MKKLISLLLILILIGVACGVWLDRSGTLVYSKSLQQEADDFLLHIRIEGVDEGVKILRSIQYIGEEDVEITHQSPLISVSIADDSHSFSGESISKKMKKGTIYHQEEAVLPVQDKGIRELSIHAKFSCNKEEINIKHIEELEFQ